MASTAPVATETAPNTEIKQQEDLQGEFKGDLSVSAALPTKEDLKKCEDLVVLDSKGSSRTFKSLYTSENTAPQQLIIFVRHFFCGNCQEYLRTLCSSINPDDLISLEKPTFITIIGCGKPELIDMYIETTGCPFPVYADPSRKLYDALGMVRTLDLGPKKPEYMQSGVLGGAIRSILQGLKSGKNAVHGGDLKQVGGEFMFEDGKVTWCHRMKNTRDHAGIAEIRTQLGLDGSTKPPMRKTWSSGLKGLARRSSSLGRPGGESEKRSSSESKRKSMAVVKEETKGSALKISTASEDVPPGTNGAIAHKTVPAPAAATPSEPLKAEADVPITTAPPHPVENEQAVKPKVNGFAEVSKAEETPAAKI